MSTIIIDIKDDKQLKALKSALKQAGISSKQVRTPKNKAVGKKDAEDALFLKLAEHTLADEWKEDTEWEKHL
jgi:hypothetical protein